jgi:hypothetical protein
LILKNLQGIKKMKITLDEHKTIGSALYGVACRLVELQVDTSNLLGKSCKLSAHLGQARKLLSDPRNYLEGICSKVFKDTGFDVHIYYPGTHNGSRRSMDELLKIVDYPEDYFADIGIELRVLQSTVNDVLDKLQSLVGPIHDGLLATSDKIGQAIVDLQNLSEADYAKAQRHAKQTCEYKHYVYCQKRNLGDLV